MARQREFDTEATVLKAMRLFQEKGYEGASMQDLVDATGVGRGSLYAAFGDKEGLFLAALDRYRDDYSTPLIELLHQGSSAPEVIQLVLSSVVDDAVRDGERHGCLIVSAATHSLASDRAVSSRVHSATSELEDALRDVIAEGQYRGEISSDHSPRDLARFFGAVTHGIRVSATINADRAALMSIVECALLAIR